MHRITFPEPHWGLLSLTKHQPFTHGTQQLLQTGDVVSKDFQRALNFHLQVEVPVSRQKQRLHTEPKAVQ